MADARDRSPDEAAAVARFEQLIAPLDLDAFAARCFGREFLHQAGAAGRFAGLVGWDDVNHVLSTQRLEAPRLNLVRGGKTVPTDRYLHTSGTNVRIDAGAMTALLAQGATMVMSFVDEMLPSVGALADDVATALMARANVNLYAGWRADHGFDIHWDHHDVIILQVAGRKHWRVHSPTRMHPLRGEQCDPPAPGDEPVFDDLLEDGAMLYLPRGWWHVATPVNEPSLHLTIAITPLNGVEYLHWLGNRLADDEDARRDLPMLEDASALTDYAERLKRRFAALIDSHGPDRFHRARMAERPARPRFQLPEFATVTDSDRLSASRLRLAGVRRLHVESSHDGRSQFEANARLWECSPEVGSAIARLSSSSAIAFSALAEPLDDTQRTELTRLLLLLTSAGVVFTDRQAAADKTAPPS